MHREISAGSLRGSEIDRDPPPPILYFNHWLGDLKFRGSENTALHRVTGGSMLIQFIPSGGAGHIVAVVIDPKQGRGVACGGMGGVGQGAGEHGG